MLIMEVNFYPFVFEVICPVWLILGQYLQRLGRLHGCVDMYVSC